MILCDFFVEGDPVAQPRLRPRMGPAGRMGVHMPRTADGWRLCVSLAARAAWGHAPVETAIAVDLRFLLRRPSSHYTPKGKLRASAPLYPTSKPDRDNLEKSTLDALYGWLWRDDAQVVDGVVSKRYVTEPHESPGAMVTMRTVDA